MWIICAYYTKNTMYEECVEKLRQSIEVFNLPHDIVPIDDLGDWYKNTQYKPVFLQQMLEKHPLHSIVYIDADAVFFRYPEYFNKLDNTSDVNIAVHVLNHSKYRRKNRPPEMLSGTIFLKNTTTTKQIVDEWIQECKKGPKLWDQCALATILRGYKYHLLPEEYCTIFDYMSSVKNPVIKHFQASREARKSSTKSSTKKKRIHSVKRRVVRNGVTHIRRSRRIS